MASPLIFYIHPIKNYAVMNLEFEVPLHQEGLNPNDLHSSRKYWITNLDDILPDNPVTVSKKSSGEVDDDIVPVTHGIMSPTDDITFPPFTREKAGISKNARKSAFLHPPPSLASRLAAIGVGLRTADDQFSLQLCMFSIFGAFVYFDERMEIVGVSVLTTTATDYALKLVGPYETSRKVVKEVQNLGRFSAMPLDLYQEQGFCEMVRSL